MPLNAQAWTAALAGQFSGINFIGPRLPELCVAIATGSVQHLTGKQFQTQDVGLTPGAGVGIGVGITGIIPTTVASTIRSTAIQNFDNHEGKRLADCCQVIAAVLVQQVLLATLSSVDSPVFAGTGTIIPGSIAVLGPAWGTAIEQAAPKFVGKYWPGFANAIGVGCAAGFQTATGILTITGAGSPLPVPGTGTGTGTIS